MTTTAIVRLGDACRIDKDQGVHRDLPYVGLEHIEANTGMFLGEESPAAVKSATFRFTSEHVLYGRLRPYLNKVLAPDFDGHCSTEIFPLRPERGLLREYLVYWLLAEETSERINATCTGARMPRANMNSVMDFEFPLPPPVEQKQIVGILDEAFDGIATAKANTEKNLENARAVFEGQRELAVKDRAATWEAATLGDDVDLLAGFAFTSAGYTDDEMGVRLLRGDNIIQGSIRWDDAKKWPLDDINPYARFQLHAGDVVLAMDRPWVQAGLKHATIGADDLPCFLVQRTARLRPMHRLDNRYLMFLIGSAGFTSHILGALTGTGVPHVSGQQIKDFAFWRPPLDEQRRIAGDLGNLRREAQHLESIYRRKLEALDELKRSLLHQAFTGQL